MIKQTIQASGFGKKSYAKPQMKAYQVKAAAIMAASENSTTSTQNEEYEEVSTSTWF